MILLFLSISPARSHGNAAEIPEAGPIQSASVEVYWNTDIHHVNIILRLDRDLK